MKKLCLAAIAFVVLATASRAGAADMPVYKAPPPPPYQHWNWTGVYFGVHTGYGWSHMTPDVGEPRSPNGLFVGGQLGFNYQFARHWVMGAEIDASYATLRDTTLQADPLVPNVIIGDFEKITFLGSARLRAGVALDRLLIYGTGGAAWGRMTVAAGNPGPGPLAPLAVTFSDRHTHTGWAAGGGIEGVLAGNWTAKVEYLYYRLARETYVIDASLGLRFDVQTIRAGLNYKLDWGPIFAKY